MKKLLIMLVMAIFALVTPVQANAATAYMNGLGGIGPQWKTITGPNGEKCDCGGWFGKDERIRYDNTTTQDAEKQLTTWLLAHPDEANTLWTYSETSQAVKSLINERPELFTNTKVIALAPPRPGSFGYEEVQAPNSVDMTQVIVKGDSVADPAGKNFFTHLSGYNNLNMQTQQPVSSGTIPGTNTDVNYYEKPVRTSWLANLFKPKSTATVKVSDKKADRKAQRAERREARKAARAERRAERKAAHEE